MIQGWHRGGRRGLVFRGSVRQLREWLAAAAAVSDLRGWISYLSAN